VKALSDFAPECQVTEILSEPGEVMNQVVLLARAIAEDGDVVLLAPAAASMDQFVDYADRGNSFARAVLEGSK
jgi:UDP-N-acetylmuramoylalanine--D-glutamate ligase